MSPVPLNPLGIKGAREAAAIPVGAVIASAGSRLTRDHNPVRQAV
jgi:hypothetical protein